jgi:hypothetical protein
VTFVKVDRRPTAVVVQTTTWTDFPRLRGQLLGEVYGFVRRRPDLVTGNAGESWQNVMLYKDQRPDAEVGVLVTTPFEPEGRVNRLRASRWGGRDSDPPGRLRAVGRHS